jgi:hypothetical protein
VHFDPVKAAGEVTNGMQDASDSLDGVEVSPKVPTAWISPVGIALVRFAS